MRRCCSDWPWSSAVPERRCPVCGASLADRDPRARACSPAHRREVARLRRLLSGERDGFYGTLTEYTSRRRRKVRANAP